MKLEWQEDRCLAVRSAEELRLAIAQFIVRNPKSLKYTKTKV